MTTTCKVYWRFIVLLWFISSNVVYYGSWWFYFAFSGRSFTIWAVFSAAPFDVGYLELLGLCWNLHSFKNSSNNFLHTVVQCHFSFFLLLSFLKDMYDLPNGCFCICFIELLNFPIYAMVIYHKHKILSIPSKEACFHHLKWAMLTWLFLLVLKAGVAYLDDFFYLSIDLLPKYFSSCCPCALFP